MKFKDFTQEAYDDIQSYMGGEEHWEEINKTYGVVETKGIFQYDYESQLRNAATEYQRQNEEAIHRIYILNGSYINQSCQFFNCSAESFQIHIFVPKPGCI